MLWQIKKNYAHTTELENSCGMVVLKIILYPEHKSIGAKLI